MLFLPLCIINPGKQVCVMLFRWRQLYNRFTRLYDPSSKEVVGLDGTFVEYMDKKKHIAIFTTASLPWLTGTAVNPLFRAAYLANRNEFKVTLVIPWLKLKDQKHVYPNNITFNSPKEQEEYVRQWLHQRTGLKANFAIRFYPGRVSFGPPFLIAKKIKNIQSIVYEQKFVSQFSLHKRSILALGDITEVIPDEEADVAVLEEPEHLTWYHHGKTWKLKFRQVIGVVHTNYLEYVRREKNGLIQAFLLKHVNNWVVYTYCHRVRLFLTLFKFTFFFRLFKDWSLSIFRWKYLLKPGPRRANGGMLLAHLQICLSSSI